MLFTFFDMFISPGSLGSSHRPTKEIWATFQLYKRHIDVDINIEQYGIYFRLIFSHAFFKLSILFLYIDYVRNHIWFSMKLFNCPGLLLLIMYVFMSTNTIYIHITYAWYWISKINHILVFYNVLGKMILAIKKGTILM